MRYSYIFDVNIIGAGNALVIRPAFASLRQIPRDGASVKIQAKGKEKLRYIYNCPHFSLFSNKIGADFIQTNSRLSFGNDILKKKLF